MKHNKKIILSAVAIMSFVAVAVTSITFSLANNGKKKSTETTNVAYADKKEADSGKTIIDYIIENSNKDDSSPYRVVELGPVAASGTTDFETFVKGGSLKDNVFNAYSTTGAVFNPDAKKIEYKYYCTSDINSASKDVPKGKDTSPYDDILAYISAADFIYISNDSSNTYDADKGNDIGEDLYDILHTYAVGKYNPLVIENPNASTSGSIIDDDITETNFYKLVDDIFVAKGKSYKAYRWDTSLSADAYLNGSLGTSSRYVGINGSSRMGYWTNVDISGESYRMSDVLVVSANSGELFNAGTLANKLLSDIAAADGTIPTVDTSDWDTEITLKSNQKIVRVYDEENDIYSRFATKAYKNIFDYPDFVKFSEVSMEGFGSLKSLDKYDMIIFEDSCGSVTFDDPTTWYEKITNVLYSNKHIVFSSNLVGKSGNTNPNPNPGTGSVSNETNYKELYYMVATEDAVSRFSNVMVTAKAEFNLLINSNNSETLKPIADIINKGAYRGIGGPGSSSTTFTVLEIQPCYPVDPDVAAIEDKSYYTIPSELVNNKTAEQIGYEKLYDESGKLTSFTINGEKVTKDNDIEYYAWELSEANIADALDMDANAIKVVHMSSEELATSKVDILGTYDMIYVGGNISSIKSAAEYASLTIFTYGDAIGPRLNNNMEAIKGLPVYSMYSHNGDFVMLRGGSVFGQAANYLTAVTPYTGSKDNTFGLYNGNDITYDTLQSLKDYIDAGMPVVIDKKVNDAYQYIADTYDKNGKITEDTYMQNAIDPDSNMCKFLNYCADATKNGTAGTKTSKVKGLKDTILWGFDQSPREMTDNNEGKLGDTATGYVSVFAEGENKDSFAKVYKDSNTRAKLAVTSMPPVYNLYDPTTKLDEKTLNFEFDVIGVDDYDVKVFADYNLDSTFSDSEALPSDVDIKKGTASCDLSKLDAYGSNFYGPVYWKLEITDNKTGSKVSTTNIAYIKAKEGTEKQKVNVLQVIPDDVAGSNATGRQGNVNLLFCTKCQRALSRLEYNPYSDQGFNYNTYYDFHLFDAAAKDGYFPMNGGPKVYIGKHEHNFGIVKYDSSMKYEGAPTAGMDDWDDNFADEVADLYDFDVDILNTRELEKISADVRAKAAEALTKYPEFDGKTLDTLTDEELEKFKGVLMTEANTKYNDYLATLPAVEDAKEALDTALEEMIEYCDDRGATKVGDYFRRILKESYYEDYYVYINGRNVVYVDTTDPEWQYGKYTPLYETYAHALDAKIDAKEAYDEANRIANFDNWLYNCYQAVIFGPAEDFNNDDIKTTECLDDIERYILSGGSTILFHSVISVYNQKANGTTGPIELSNRIRGLVGMDKNHLEVDEATLGTSAVPYYIPYIAETVNNVDGTVTKYSPNKYYYMNLSYKLKSDADTFFNWDKDIAEASKMGPWDSGISPNKYLSNVAYTNTTWVEIAGYGGANPTPYRYSKYNHMHATTYARAEAEKAKRGTDRAAQTNKGIITMYPFTLSEALNISGTHSQSYALDIENSTATVWYTFGGGSNNLGDFHKDDSSIYAASPKDGADSYFIYSFGNVFYCGAGHSEITGMGKDNNDERRLYINVICNTVTNEGVNSLEVYDYQKNTNDIVVKAKAVDYDYTYKLDADPDATGVNPELSFAVSTAKGNSVTSMKVYYDYGDKGTSEIKDYKYNTQTGMYDAPEDVDNVKDSLKLDTSKLINNKYAYLVIEVKTSKGITLKKTVKVMLKSYLFNLT